MQHVEVYRKETAIRNDKLKSTLVFFQHKHLVSMAYFLLAYLHCLGVLKLVSILWFVFVIVGYCFLLFQDEMSVQALINSCVKDDGKLYWSVSSPTIKDKPVSLRNQVAIFEMISFLYYNELSGLSFAKFYLLSLFFIMLILILCHFRRERFIVI